MTRSLQMFAIFMPLLAAPAAAAPVMLFEATLDIDNDGKMDRAALVETPDGGADLYIYLAAGDEKLDLSRKPSFLKAAVIDGTAIGLESKGKGSLLITSCYGCGANKSWEETLTIVHRHGAFQVGGFTRDWDWNVHTSDATVETTLGGCDINFLTGKATVTVGLEDGKPLKKKFKPVKLADWRADRRPAACEF